MHGSKQKASSGRLIHNRFPHLLGTKIHLPIIARVQYVSENGRKRAGLHKHISRYMKLACQRKYKSEWVNPGLLSHQQRGHMETGPRFKDSSERPEKRGDRSCDPWIGSLACYPVHYRRSWKYRKSYHCLPCAIVSALYDLVTLSFM